MTGRWEWLEGVRRIGAAQAIGEELGKLLSVELRSWPPRVEWEDAARQRKFAVLYADGAPPPSHAAVLEGLRLARLDVAREPETIAAFLRGDGASASVGDALARELVWQFAYEAALVVLERTEGRVRRSDIVNGLKLAERLVAAS